jgi:hypothetical protein
MERNRRGWRSLVRRREATPTHSYSFSLSFCRFGEHCVDKMIRLLKELSITPDTNPKVVDIGTGNGYSLFELVYISFPSIYSLLPLICSPCFLPLLLFTHISRQRKVTHFFMVQTPQRRRCTWQRTSQVIKKRLLLQKSHSLLTISQTQNWRLLPSM